MPEVNRYTQMPQPLILNPLSFEELSRVPLAKAQASAEGAAALNRIQTDYNVDERDLGQVTQWVDEIDQQKTNIVDNMFNQGVTNQVVNDVLKLKRDRDNLYKTKINQAEENKRRIEAWRQSVDQKYAKDSPAYAEFVKQKEIANWQGTFAYGDTPQTFVGSMGPDYFDTKKDVFEYLSQAKEMTELESKYRAAGAPREVTVGDYQGIYTPGEYSKQVLSNRHKLLAVADQLRGEYKDPNSKRGQFKSYVNMSDEELDLQINQAMNAYLQEMTKEQGGGGSYSGMQKKEEPPQDPIPYFGKEAQEYVYKVLDNLNQLNTGNLDNVVSSWKEMNEEYVGSHWDNLPGVEAYKRVKLFAIKLFSKSKGTEEARTKLVKENFKEVAAELEKQGIITRKERMIAQGYRDNNSRLSDKDYENIQLSVLNKIQKHVLEHSTENQQANILSPDDMWVNYGLDTRLDPVKTAADMYKEGFQIYDRKTRKLISPKDDKEEYEAVKRAMLLGRAERLGVIAPYSPDLKNERGDYIPGLVSANNIVIKDDDKDYKKYFGREYYIKQPTYVREQDERFLQQDEKSEIITNIPIGGSGYLLITNDKGKPVPVEIKHTGVTGGDYRIYIPGEKEGINLYSREGQMIDAMLYGPKALVRKQRLSK